MTYQVNHRKITTSGDTSYRLLVRNLETGFTFEFDREIQSIHNCIMSITEYLNKGGALFRFNWRGF